MGDDAERKLVERCELLEISLRKAAALVSAEFTDTRDDGAAHLVAIRRLSTVASSLPPRQRLELSRVLTRAQEVFRVRDAVLAERDPSVDDRQLRRADLTGWSMVAKAASQALEHHAPEWAKTA